MIIMNAGSSYFEHVENYYGSNACEQNSCRNAVMPEELKTEKAQRIKNNLIEIGLVTEDFMPLGISTSEAAVLAYQIGIELEIKNIWSVFGNYWGPRSVRGPDTPAFASESPSRSARRTTSSTCRFPSPYR